MPVLRTSPPSRPSRDEKFNRPLPRSADPNCLWPGLWRRPVFADSYQAHGQRGREGALRRPLSGAFPPAAGQPPRAAGQREDCASGDSAARCPYHSRTMSRCAPRKAPANFSKEIWRIPPGFDACLNKPWNCCSQNCCGSNCPVLVWKVCPNSYG
jgi:hypothetical protein